MDLEQRTENLRAAPDRAGRLQALRDLSAAKRALPKERIEMPYLIPIATPRESLSRSCAGATPLIMSTTWPAVHSIVMRPVGYFHKNYEWFYGRLRKCRRDKCPVTNGARI
jgi:hypothetical protein